MDKTIKGILIILTGLLALGLGYYFLVGRSNSEMGNGVSVTQRSGLADNGNTSSETVSLSNYVDYSEDKLQESMDNGKVVLLYFTANWCPTCRAQEPINVSLFESLQGDEEIIAYRVHILDDETTQEEESLANKYIVRLQHSFVLLNQSGEVVFTHTGPLTGDDLMTQLMEAKGDG